MEYPYPYFCLCACLGPYTMPYLPSAAAGPDSLQFQYLAAGGQVSQQQQAIFGVLELRG